MLVRFRSKKAVPTLISLLYDKDHLARYSGIRQLVLVDGREAVPHIAKLLRDEDLNNRYWALDALVKFGAKERVADIWFLTSGHSPETEAYAVAALVYFADTKGIQVALDRIATLDASWGNILEKITELKAKAITPGLIALLENPPPSTPVYGRSDIVYALGKLEAKEASPVLRNYIYRFPMGRVQAIQVLGGFEDKDAVDDLLNIFTTYLPNPPSSITNETYDGAEAAVALAKIGDPRTWKLLIDAAENPQYPYRSQIIQELNKHINAALWKRVESANVFGQDFASIKINAAAFSDETKITISLEYDPNIHFFRFATPGEYPQLRIVPKEPLRTGLKDIVSGIDSGTLPNRFTYLMDGEKVRILPVEDAVKWWRMNILNGKTKN